ncbi:MAG TPA: response regulator [Verrucomicrobiae bacterium]|nr:response regulator [Verrucomicrobiae bacterium]
MPSTHQPGLAHRIPPKRILVVEDDPVAAHTIRTILAVDGHTVEVAQDGEQALVRFSAGDYDLVITDFKLAEMDGMELAAAIRQHSPAKPIILITAYTEAIKGGLGKVSNVDLVLRKPFSVAELQAALGKVFPSS